MRNKQDWVRKSIASGAAWMISFRMADRFIGVISTAVLARLLTPDDFGVVALALSMIAVLDMMGELSFELALIRDQEATEAHYHTAWTARVIKALLLFAILNIAAGPSALFFGDPRLRPVVHVLSFTVVLAAAQSILITDLRKELDFEREFRFRIVSRLCGFFITLGLAWLWRDHWAMVYGTLATEAVRFVMSYIMMPYRPRLTLSQFREIFEFSKWLLAGNIFLALMKRSPSLAIGRLADAQTVGLYTLATQICGLASTELVAPIKRALFPGYSKLVSDFEALRQVYLENFSVIVLLAMPIAAGIGLTAEFIVPLFLGNQWLESIPVMQVIAIHAALRTINTNSNPLYYATNHTRFYFFLTAADVLVLLPALWIFVPRWGAVGSAIAVVCASATITALDSFAVVRLLGVPWTRFAASIWRTIASILVMAIGTTELKLLMARAGMSSLLGQLILTSLSGAAMYVGAHLLLWRLSGSPESAEKLLLRLAGKLADRIVPARRVLPRTD
jgi:PST family polysaccharide transporter